MPPRKPKAAAASSSQPLQDRPARAASRKRTHSDASNVSDKPSSSQSNADSGPAKRRKKAKAAASLAEPEVIVEEDEQAAALEDREESVPRATPQVSDKTADNQDEETIEVAYSTKHVHFGGDSAATDEPSSTATHTTPHPQKKTFFSRLSFSPASWSRAKDEKPTATRASLPTQFGSQEIHRFVGTDVQVQFAPLRQVLEQRVERRRTIHSHDRSGTEEHANGDARTHRELDRQRLAIAEARARIRELLAEREKRLHLDGAEEIQEELETQQQKLADLKAGRRLDVDDLPDDNMMVLDSQEEIKYPLLPSPPSSHLAVDKIMKSQESKVNSQQSSASSQLSLSAAALEDHETERRRFQDAILALSREADDAKARLRILEIELQSLGFGDEHVDPLTILKSIRASLDQLHETMDIALPDTLPPGSSTQGVLNFLMANFKDFSDRLRSQDQELLDRNDLISKLSGQINGLLDHLAEKELTYNKLFEEWQMLDESNDEQARTIEDVEEKLDALRQEKDALQQALEQKTEQHASLSDENAEAVANLEKLQNTLVDYRKEEDRLSNLITRMEKEHLEDVEKMTVEREQEVQDLNTELEDEMHLRAETEQISNERQNTIAELQSRIDNITAERHELAEELHEIIEDRDEERKAREALEGELGERNNEVEGLETRVGRLEEELGTLDEQLDELRRLNETERLQREAAERDLDNRNTDVKNLNEKLQNQGIQANELRSQIFALQQQNAQRVKELEQVASERDEQYQTDMAKEVARREAADDLAQQRAATIATLEEKLQDIESRMLEAVAERDEQITALHEQVAQKNSTIEDLKMDLRSAEDDLDNERTQHEERIQELQAGIAAGQEMIAEREATIQQMREEALHTTSLHDSEIEDRNDKIAQLHADMGTLRAEIDALTRDKAGLERRVEEEAEQMLEFQNDKENEMDRLKAMLDDKQRKILVVEEKAVEADQRWQEVLTARDAEIADLKSSGKEREDVIATLTTSNASLKRRFMDYIRRSSAVVADMRAAVDTAKAVADAECEAIRDESGATLEELEAMDDVPAVKVIPKTPKTVPSKGGKKAGRSKKRPFDSGIGVEEDREADEEMIVAE